LEISHRAKPEAAKAFHGRAATENVKLPPVFEQEQLRLVTGMFSGRCPRMQHLNIGSQKMPQDRKRNRTIHCVNPKICLGTEKRSLALTSSTDRCQDYFGSEIWGHKGPVAMVWEIQLNGNLSDMRNVIILYCSILLHCIVQ
jgi:hypothetical protein